MPLVLQGENNILGNYQFIFKNLLLTKSDMAFITIKIIQKQDTVLYLSIKCSFQKAFKETVPEIISSKCRFPFFEF